MEGKSFMSFYTDRMEQLKMEPMRKKHPDWIWNRSDTHMFLKVPEAHDAFATVVEPGNSFSPGPGTYGISTWVTVDGRLYAPEEYDINDFTWEFEDKKYPISNVMWKADGICVKSSLFTWQNGKLLDYRDYFRVSLINESDRTKKVDFDLVVRSFGAAGGPIKSLSERDGVIYINKAALVYAETRGRFGAISYGGTGGAYGAGGRSRINGTGQTGQDISVLLKAGRFPETAAAEDPEEWASGAMRYSFELKPGESASYDFACHLHAECEMYRWLKPLAFPLGFDEKKALLKEAWDKVTKAEINVPDHRVRDAFYAQINHLYMAAGLEAPHISPVTYPTWWMRDSAYICTTLEQAGLYDFAGRCAEHAGRYKVSAPFGPEADLQGCRVWVISEHYLLTRDMDYLKRNYKYVVENAEEILQMCNTDTPLTFFSESTNHQTVNWPMTAFTCAPSEHGLCKGRMDFFYPVFYCNSFCYLGLRRAAICAYALGLEDDAKRYGDAAARIRKSLLDYVPGRFARVQDKSVFYDECHPNDAGKEETFCHHDTCSAFYPGGWGDAGDERLMKEYDTYWNKALCPNDKQVHEPLWTYMEIGDARNRLIIGERERAWTVINYYLDNHTCPGLYTWHESCKDENSVFLAWEKVRGWDRAPFVTPHGWSGSLMLGMMRDIMVREDDEGTIRLGIGVPEEWMDKPFSIKNFPTYYGEISYNYDPKQRKVYVHLEKTADCRIVSDFPAIWTLIR